MITSTIEKSLVKTLNGLTRDETIQVLVEEHVKAEENFTAYNLGREAMQRGSTYFWHWRDIEPILQRIAESTSLLKEWNRCWWKVKKSNSPGMVLQPVWHPKSYTRPDRVTKLTGTTKSKIQSETVGISATLIRDALWEMGDYVYAHFDEGVIHITDRNSLGARKYKIDTNNRLSISPATINPEFVGIPWKARKQGDFHIVLETLGPEEELQEGEKEAKQVNAPEYIDIGAELVKKAGWNKGQTIWVWVEGYDNEAIIKCKRGSKDRPITEFARPYTVDSHRRLRIHPEVLDPKIKGKEWKIYAFDFKIELIQKL